MDMTPSLVSPAYIGRRKDDLNLKLSTGRADIKRHGVLIAAVIFSKVLTRISCATPCAERFA
jgi:hypothetical protein